MNQSRTNIIASNTLFLYLRSFVTMIIGVYTSRVLLSTLGVDDYGVYNLVGGIVTMFASLKTIFASAIQRFLNYEKGTGITERVQMVFNTGLIVQFILAFVFCIVVEVIGMWFIANKLNIPEKSISDAYFVFHLSVATAVLAILTAPFDATIIANEKMKVFAWLSMINSILKLIIVFSLPIIGGDYLRVYALLLLLVTVFDITFNIWYTRRFPECKIRFRLDKTMFKNIASFSGWVFLGNSAFSAVNEGINFMLNIFGGVAYNASRAIAYQLKSAISTLSANIIVASRPYIVQQSAINDKQHTYLQICKLSRLVFMVMALTVFPFIIFADTILRVWLVEPPIMSTLFVQLVLIHLLVRSLHEPIDTLFKSFGEIKYYQIFDSLTLALTLPISYAVLKMGAPIYSVFIVIIIVEVITLSILLVLIKKQFRLSMQYYLRNVFSLCLQATILFSIIGLVFYLFMPDNIYFRLVFFLLFCLIEIIAAYILLLDNSERQLVVSVLKRMK